MTMKTKNEVFGEYLEQYLKASKNERGVILDHICFVAKVHRKAAIRKFRRLQLRDPYCGDKRGRSEYYGPEVTIALKEIWETGDEICGELLYPIMLDYVNILQRDGQWKHDSLVTGKLLAMSLATIKRRVGNFLKARGKRGGFSATRPSLLKNIIPTFNGPWKDLPPGNGQIDTVIHNDTLLGDSVYTLNYTDSATCLCISRAQWNKSQTNTVSSMEAIQDRLPFPWLLAHPDSGSEFINKMALDWTREQKIIYVRSRANKKNDNMYVEERNGHVIRKHVGYITLDCIEVVDALNHYYDILTPYLMHFIPVRRMIDRQRIGSKYKRVYEKVPLTPYQRILAHSKVTSENKDKLILEHGKLNPKILKNEMDNRLKKVYDIQRQYGNKRDRTPGNLF